MKHNLIVLSDSYKFGHHKLLPPNTTRQHSYIEARGGAHPLIRFFGLQMFLKEYLCNHITLDDINYAKQLIEAHGEPFNYDGWMYIYRHHNGYLPVVINAVPEGLVVPIRNALVTIENTDPNCAWLTSFLETALLKAVWYPSTVATISYEIKQLILKFLERSGNPESIAFKLHCFGYRGMSSEETARIGGLAHLTNFMGTDTVAALIAGREYYGCDMAGFSIPASEHSVMTCLGRAGEAQQFERMIDQFAGPGKIYACVSDGYDIFNAVENIWGKQLRNKVINSGGTLVVRPDGGDPVSVVLRVIQLLDKQFGSTKNEKGFKVLHPSVRVIQGDGVNYNSIEAVLTALTGQGYSADNVAFGMGAELTQKVNRDTCQWAMKCSAIEIDGVWRDVFKAPITDPGKNSKKGRLMLTNTNGIYKTEQLHQITGTPVLREVFRDGKLLIDETLDVIRARS